MWLGTRALPLLVATGMAQLLGGCQGDLPQRLAFPLRDLSFTVPDTSYPSGPPGGLRTMVCAGPLALVSDCCTPPAPAEAIDCEQHPLACDPDEHLCALAFEVERTANTNLVEQVAAVAAVDGRVFSSMSLLDMTAKVTDSEKLAIRRAALYIGPAGLGSAASPTARLIAEIPLAATSVIEPSAEAQQAFSSFARDYRATFTWLLAAHVVVRPGFTPSGTATFTVSTKAEAWY